MNRAQTLHWHACADSWESNIISSTLRKGMTSMNLSHENILGVVRLARSLLRHIRTRQTTDHQTCEHSEAQRTLKSTGNDIFLDVAWQAAVNRPTLHPVDHHDDPAHDARKQCWFTVSHGVSLCTLISSNVRECDRVSHSVGVRRGIEGSMLLPRRLQNSQSQRRPMLPNTSASRAYALAL